MLEEQIYIYLFLNIVVSKDYFAFPFCNMNNDLLSIAKIVDT